MRINWKQGHWKPWLMEVIILSLELLIEEGRFISLLSLIWKDLLHMKSLSSSLLAIEETKLVRSLA